MNELQIIDEREVLGKQLRIYGDFENPLFLAKDVAEWIDYSKNSNGAYNISNMLKTIDDDEKLVLKILISGQNREMLFVTEEGLYEVLMQSTKPIAKIFKKKVKEILKSIRKNGGYIVTKENDTPEMIMARAVLVAQKTINEQKEKIQNLVEENKSQKQIITELKPMKEYMDTILSSNNTMTITQIAADYGLSGLRLNKILHDERFIRNVNGQWLLYSEHMNKGYTKSETIIMKRKDGTDKAIPTTKWTQKGRLKIHNILTNLGFLANMDKEKKIS